MSNIEEFENPTYNWVNEHEMRQADLGRASRTESFWGVIPGLVYCGAITLLSVVLGMEISKLFVGDILLQIIGWGCVVVVGLSAIASYYGKSTVYKSGSQQRLGKLFWVLEVVALTIGLLVAIADAFHFSGLILDVARFLGFMSVVVAAFGWGVIRWAAPEWKVAAEHNKTEAELAVKMAQIDSQFSMSDQMIFLRMLAAWSNAKARAIAALPTGVTPDQVEAALEKHKSSQPEKPIIEQPTAEASAPSDADQSLSDKIKSRLKRNAQSNNGHTEQTAYAAQSPVPLEQKPADPK